MQSNDPETLGSDAHQFKGAAANLGAKAIAQAASKGAPNPGVEAKEDDGGAKAAPAAEGSQESGGQ